MACTSPRTVGFKADGKTIAWSQKEYSKEYPTFQLPCGKCIECRLDYSRQWSIRCFHESSIHEQNCFITLTYSDEHLTSPKLVYPDFQKFMKRLRKTTNNEVGVFVTGEYGEINKRPHWHAIIFNWEPRDKIKKYTTDRGDQVYESATLSKLWPWGIAELGSVTMESAGYCARYSLKKIAHGPDGHEWEPISRKSSKHAIGKKWLEKNYLDIFNHGKLLLKDGTSVPIPRYYEKWLKQNHPLHYIRYVTEIKSKNISLLEKKQEILDQQLRHDVQTRREQGVFINPRDSREIRRILANEKFKKLQENLKL